MIELDRDLAARLRRTPGLEVIEADVLDVDFAALARSRGDAKAARRRQPAVQHLDADPVSSARRGRPHRRPALHAAEGGGRAHRRGARRQGLRPPDRDAAVALRDRAAARRAARGVRAAAARRFGGAAHDAAAGAAGVDPALLRELVTVGLLAAAQAPAPHARPLARGARRAGTFDVQRRAEEVPVDEYLRPRRRAGKATPEGGLPLGGSAAGEGQPDARQWAAATAASAPCRRRCS